MRAPFQILAIPYRLVYSEPIFCILKRSDADWWQFITVGGEDNETPLETAKREILEEAGITSGNLKKLTFMTYLPADCTYSMHCCRDTVFTLNVILKSFCRMNILNMLGCLIQKRAESSKGALFE